MAKRIALSSASLKITESHQLSVLSQVQSKNAPSASSVKNGVILSQIKSVVKTLNGTNSMATLTPSVNSLLTSTSDLNQINGQICSKSASGVPSSSNIFFIKTEPNSGTIQIDDNKTKKHQSLAGKQNPINQSLLQNSGTLVIPVATGNAIPPKQPATLQKSKKRRRSKAKVDPLPIVTVHHVNPSTVGSLFVNNEPVTNVLSNTVQPEATVPLSTASNASKVPISTGSALGKSVYKSNQKKKANALSKKLAKKGIVEFQLAMREI